MQTAQNKNYKWLISTYWNEMSNPKFKKIHRRLLQNIAVPLCYECYAYVLLKLRHLQFFLLTSNIRFNFNSILCKPLLYDGVINADEIYQFFDQNRTPTVKELTDDTFEHLT